MGETGFECRWRAVATWGLAVLLAVAGCTAGGPSVTPTPPPEGTPGVEVRISGSGTTCSILAAIVPIFERDTPGYHVRVLPGAGTGGGVTGTIEGMLDLAAMDRRPTGEEITEGLEYLEFGLSAVAAYAHPAVGVTDLTRDQIADMFAGDIDNWSAVGGPQLPIVLYVREEGDSTTGALRQGILGDRPFPGALVRVLTSESEMQELVSKTVGGVGFGSWPAAVAAGAKVQAISVEGASPDEDRYPYVIPVGLGYMAWNQSYLQPLLDWLESENAWAALRDLGVVIP